MIGELVYDCALGRNGIVISGAFTEMCDNRNTTLPINWEWLVLYDDGEMMGAETSDLTVINESR
tara:strand:+ start:809 stop:1000 length:192 start_codon:yes stop_codon:yes gene_type:complete